MFKHLSVKEQLQIEQQKSKALQAHIQELEDALVELAEIVAANEEELHNG
jgi:hypothetical protein